MVRQLKIFQILSFLILSCLCFTKCQDGDTKLFQPNILWIMLEDTSPLLGCYGETVIQTPHIDKLAEGGILFEHAIMPAPVCSPCRSSIITGIMSTSLGTHNHHSARTPESSIYLPKEIKTIPELFKAEGYFTFNNGKDDYNFTYDRKDLYSQEYEQHALYGKRGMRIAFEDLLTKTPFFGQVQLSGGKEIFSPTFQQRVKNPVDRSRIELPPYIPHHPVMIEEYANHLDAIQITDQKLGDIIDELDKYGLLENTIVFFFSDHGMRITRHKQFLYEGGIRVPLIIADFTNTYGFEVGSVNKELVSGIDIGPSSLALAGIDIPHYIEGVNIFENNLDRREFVISTRDRCDFSIDRIRSVRTKDFKYIRNFLNDRRYAQPSYMDVDEVPFVITMHKLHKENSLDSLQSLFFRSERPTEELYDLKSDPFELHNLATKPYYTDVLEHHSKILDHWIQKTDDKGQYPEGAENLKLMLGIWGDHAVNPEYDVLKEMYPDLAGSLFDLKTSGWQTVTQQSNDN